jgi:hypothetical protein
VHADHESADKESDHYLLNREKQIAQEKEKNVILIIPVHVKQ